MLADKTQKLVTGGLFGKFYQHLTNKGKSKIKPQKNIEEDLDEPQIEEWDDVEYYPKDSFRQASSLFIFLGQFLCFIPLNHNEFRWFSLRVIFAIAAIICNATMTFVCLLWVQNGGVNIFKGGTVIFFGASTIAMTLFIHLSTKWPSLIKCWEKHEKYYGHRKHLSYKYNLVTLFTIVITFLEHISSLITGLITARENSKEILKHYCEKRFPQVFELVEFRLWLGFLVLIVNMVACLTFAFVDTLVIIFSIGLSSFFEEFNERIGQERKQKLQPREWKTFRTDYTRICNLVSAVDDCSCHLLFSTFALHLLTICIELHHSMLLSADREERIHIIFAFIIAGGQACALCYFTCGVHDKSRVPLSVLYAVPSISYCQEVVGTVLSYEILLLQLRMITAGKATLTY